MNIVNWARRKPIWLEHDGYWRMLQLARILACAPFAAFTVAGLGVYGYECITTPGFSRKDWIEAFQVLMPTAVGSVAAFLAVHFLARAIAWIVAGFKVRKTE